MTDPILSSTTGMNNTFHPVALHSAKQHQSRAGYLFSEEDDVWILDKDNKIHTSTARQYLNKETWDAFISTLVHYARTMSAAHTRNICDRFTVMVSDTKASNITTTVLINYRATLDRDTEWYLGTIRGFLYKWHALGYPGIGDDVIDLLKGWRLKGNVKGDAVQRLDPTQGPLTDNELMAFNEGVVRGFETNLISITGLAMSLLTSHTGRRPRQIAYMKICDLDGTQKNKKGEPFYLIRIPRVKQQGEVFRDSFKAFAMTQELWVVLNAQRTQCIESVERKLGYELQEADRLMLPLFPDLKAFTKGMSVSELRELLDTDRLHLASLEITKTLRQVVLSAKCYSERTGDLLEIVATRFRYTTGTRAAREGHGTMVIAELLDHSDTQNADVYIKNIPEHAAALDKAVGLLMAPYAQAFQGVLVDREGEAQRGDDLTSRIRHKGQGTGTCGTYGFCGANVPIPCYTCRHFQPWLDGPHEIIYADLLAERGRIMEITGDGAIAAVNDRTIFAVAQVIQQCQKRHEELQQKAGE
ncbi:MAG: recombinase [Pseudomonadota bacterium]|nr:recombinase [Pseudomonadota bacterium]